MSHPRHYREIREPVCRARLRVGSIIAALLSVGCSTEHAIKVEPTQHTVEIEPIYMTVDINIRVQRELDRFYSDVVNGAQAQLGQGGKL